MTSILLEDQYGVGDAITAGTTSGTVEAVGLRVTRVRDVNGVVWHIRNGSLQQVGNQSQGWARAVIDIPVPYNQDMSEVREVMTFHLAATIADVLTPALTGEGAEAPDAGGTDVERELVSAA